MDAGLKTFANSLGIDQIGIAPARIYHELADSLYPVPFCENQTSNERINPFLVLKSAQSVIVYLIPYYDGENREHNISRYAWGRDYHIVSKELSYKFENYLKEHYENYEGAAACDITPLPQKYLAYLAGLGFFGDHHLLINDIYGTYFFIAHILTNIPFAADEPQKKECLHCGACQKICSMGVLDKKKADFFSCVSAITQKKSPLSEKEEIVLKDSIWGCDRCQDVCPYNKKAKVSPLLSYFGQAKPIFSGEEDFPKDRAYSYKRRKFMLRNLTLQRKARSHDMDKF